MRYFINRDRLLERGAAGQQSDYGEEQSYGGKNFLDCCIGSVFVASGNDKEYPTLGRNIAFT